LDAEGSSLRVLHLLKTSTGAAWALRQMRELVRLGIDVHVALPPGGALYKRYEQAGVQTHPFVCDFPTRHPWLLPNRLRGLRRLVDEVSPCLLHSHFVGTTLTMRLALAGRPSPKRIFQVPGPLHLEQPLARMVELNTASDADHWIASCQWTQNCYHSLGIPRPRVSLSYYGIDLDHFDSGTPGKLRSELNIDPQTPIVGMVAYIYAPKWYLGHRRGIKGHEDLIEAMAILRDQGQNFHLVFAGGPWNNAAAYENRIQRYAKRQLGDRVSFLGTRTDIPDLYQDFQLVVHPSHSENLGGAIESLSSAVPTIATRIGGFPDVVIPDKTGWLTPPKNPKILAKVIHEALLEPTKSKRLALAGRELCRQMFSARKTSESISTIYETILNQDVSAETTFLTLNPTSTGQAKQEVA